MAGPTPGQTPQQTPQHTSGLTSGQQRADGATRATIPPPDAERVVYRADPAQVEGARRARFDLPATLGGALAALGAFVLLSALVGAVVGSIGYQADVDDSDLGIGGLIAGLAVLFVACLLGGWVAGRIARRRGGLHGLVAVLWLVVLAAAVAALAALFGDDLDVRDRLGLPSWFDSDALGVAALITGLVALALMLLGGYLGGKWGERHRQDEVELVEHRSAVRRHPGGIVAEGRR
jgi:hypothetical protein